MLCYSYALFVHFQSTGRYAFSCRKVDISLQCVNDLSVCCVREGESGADECTGVLVISVCSVYVKLNQALMSLVRCGL